MQQRDFHRQDCGRPAERQQVERCAHHSRHSDHVSIKQGVQYYLSPETKAIVEAKTPLPKNAVALGFKKKL
ncbi:MAG: hypothetical protein NTW59_03445, partial [Candidatus Diapherotrites archaeon]|nr:hypothetical protein [Candidatus Diapherotrites archaeon]